MWWTLCGDSLFLCNSWHIIAGSTNGVFGEYCLDRHLYYKFSSYTHDWQTLVTILRWQHKINTASWSVYDSSGSVCIYMRSCEVWARQTRQLQILSETIKNWKPYNIYSETWRILIIARYYLYKREHQRDDCTRKTCTQRNLNFTIFKEEKKNSWPPTLSRGVTSNISTVVACLFPCVSFAIWCRLCLCVSSVSAYFPGWITCFYLVTTRLLSTRNPSEISFRDSSPIQVVPVIQPHAAFFVRTHHWINIR